ncbi:MAG: hypothetical protein R3283_08495 [Balneolaceae bacterium]|nr:hypothetical protein [Balneolaceae bacterium]
MRLKSKFSHFTLFIFLFALVSCDSGSVTNPDDDNNGGGNNGFSYNHRQNAGSSAEDFLTDADFENLTLQVQYMEGYEPNTEALDNLESFLAERLNKTTITILEPESIPAGGQSSYTAAEVRSLEDNYRTEYTDEGNLAAYLLILDGEFSTQNVLGIAYYNTSMALFGETIAGSSDGIGQPSKSVIETIVMQHEVGHIIGLVNNGVEMQSQHQDEENGAHCDVDSCLMYFAVRTTDFFANIFGGTIPELDAQCIDDLQAAGGK